MLKQLFGKYLVENGKLTKAQYQIVSEKQASARVKLGLIAVEEKLLTKEQADELNQLQTQMDKRFGDIAVEKGYLTDEQVGMLLKKQGNAYLQFIQTISESGFMTLSDIDENMLAFLKDSGFSKDELDALKSDDTAKIVPLFVPDKDEKIIEILTMILKNITRFISTDYYIENVKKTDSIQFVNIAGQNVTGDDEHVVCFADKAGTKALAYIASLYNKDTLAADSPEVFDAIGEFTNCINGLLVSKEADETSTIDMEPPYGYRNGKITGELVEVPINVGGVSFSIVLSTKSIDIASGEKVEALEAEEVVSQNTDGKKILIVDDSRISRKVLRDVLEGAGYCVVGEAINGQEAVKTFIKVKPDLVTMDITMPVMDGIEALSEIMKLDSKANVVMLSAAGMKSKVVEAVKLGAKEFISKPFDKDVIIKVLSDVLE